MTALLSRQVVNSLFAHLQTVHSVSRDEVPLKLETLCTTLQQIFGDGSKTIGTAIARKLYAKLALTFSDNPSRSLLEYVEEAKIMLKEREGQL
jgi:hypothetical protein